MPHSGRGYAAHADPQYGRFSKPLHGSSDRRDNRITRGIESHEKQDDSIWAIGNSADHSMFATASEDGFACVWNASDGTKKFCVEHGGSVYVAHFAENDQFLFTGGENASVKKWDVANGELVKTLDYSSPVWDLAVSPDNQWLAVGLKDGVVNIYRLDDLDRPPFRVTMSDGVLTTVFSHNSKWLGIGTDAGEVRYLERVARLGLASFAKQAAFGRRRGRRLGRCRWRWRWGYSGGGRWR